MAQRVTTSPTSEVPWEHVVVCFVVRREFRGQGLMAELALAGTEWALDHGARIIEGYPLDPAEKKVTAATLFHGTVGAFLAAGYAVAARPSPGRAVMRLVSPRS